MKILWEILKNEVDTLSPEFMDILAGQFREMYLDRESNNLHCLALIGVRAVSGTGYCLCYWVG